MYSVAVTAFVSLIFFSESCDVVRHISCAIVLKWSIRDVFVCGRVEKWKG